MAQDRRFGVILGPSGGILGPIWGDLGPSWVIWGRLEVDLGASWAIEGRLEVDLGASWAILGLGLGDFLRFGAVLRPSWGSSSGPETSLGITKGITCEKYFGSHCVFHLDLAWIYMSPKRLKTPARSVEGSDAAAVHRSKVIDSGRTSGASAFISVAGSPGVAFFGPAPSSTCLCSVPAPLLCPPLLV